MKPPKYSIGLLTRSNGVQTPQGAEKSDEISRIEVSDAGKSRRHRAETECVKSPDAPQPTTAALIDAEN